MSTKGNPTSIAEIKRYDGHVETLMGCRPLPEDEVKALCEKAKEILSSESSVVSVPVPVTICGDVHGQLIETINFGQSYRNSINSFWSIY